MAETISPAEWRALGALTEAQLREVVRAQLALTTRARDAVSIPQNLVQLKFQADSDFARGEAAPAGSKRDAYYAAFSKARWLLDEIRPFLRADGKDDLFDSINVQSRALIFPAMDAAAGGSSGSTLDAMRGDTKAPRPSPPPPKTKPAPPAPPVKPSEPSTRPPKGSTLEELLARRNLDPTDEQRAAYNAGWEAADADPRSAADIPTPSAWAAQSWWWQLGLMERRQNRGTFRTSGFPTAQIVIGGLGALTLVWLLGSGRRRGRSR